MEFSPQKVIEWYTEKPKWAKILLSVFFVVLILLAAIWWVLGFIADNNTGHKNDSLNKLTEALENKYTDDFEETKVESNFFKKEAEKEKETRVEIEKKREKIWKERNENNKIFSALDDNSAADDVVAALNKQRNRRR